MNKEQARIIDRLRDAAREHGEVAVLLEVLAECYRPVADGEISDEAWAYLATAVAAAAFVALDRPLKGQE